MTTERRRHLPDHSVDRSAERGWELLENWELLRKAEEEGYQVIVTTDQNLRFQQNLANFKLAVVVLLGACAVGIRESENSLSSRPWLID